MSLIASPEERLPLIQVPDPKPNVNPQIVVINANPEKTEKKIRKIEQIKKFKISKRQEPSELLKYYNYLSYEQPELLAKIYERKDNDLVSGLKTAFGQDNKETLSSKVNTSGFEDPINVERLRNELFDAEEKIAEDRRKEVEMARNIATERISSFARMTRARAQANALREEEEKRKEEEEKRKEEEEKRKEEEQKRRVEEKQLKRLKNEEIQKISQQITSINRSIKYREKVLKPLDPVKDKSKYNNNSSILKNLQEQKAKLENKRKELKS